MSSSSFSPGHLFRWENGTYEVNQAFPQDRTINIQDVFTSAIRLVDQMELLQAWQAGDLKFIPRLEQPQAAKGDKLVDLSDYTDYQVAVANYRLSVIEPLVEYGLGVSSKIIRGRITELKEEHPIERKKGDLSTSLSVHSIRRWLKLYILSGNDIRSLIPRTDERGGKGCSRLKGETRTITTTVVTEKGLGREVATVDDVLQEIARQIKVLNSARGEDEQLSLPARSTVAHQMACLDAQIRYEAKHGKRAARRACKQHMQTPYPTVPLERVEIDHTRADLIVLDDDDLPLGRPTFTFCLDMATRYPLGCYLGFEPASYFTVMECLFHAIYPKEDLRELYELEHLWTPYGVPSLLVVDNGPEFVGQDLKDACLSLGIVLEPAPVATPEFKGGMERILRTLNVQLYHTIPGTTFSNPRERGDYQSEDLACVRLSDLDQVFTKYIVDVYAENYHRGLNGVPARRWEAAVQSGFSPNLPHSAEDLSILLGRVAYRTVQHYGVEFESLRYNCSELSALRARLGGEQTKIKYHPGDMSQIFVLDPDEREYICVPALAQEYTQGLSLWKHKVVRNAVLEEKRQVDLAALGEAKRKIQEIVREGRERRRGGSRTRSARWETAGQSARKLAKAKKAENPTPPAAESAPAPSPPEVQDKDLTGKPGDGWGLTFDLPRSRQQELASS